MIAQVDEQEPAVIADAMHPARDPYGLADVALAERVASVGAVAMHDRTQGFGVARSARKAHGGWGLSTSRHTVCTPRFLPERSEVTRQKRSDLHTQGRGATDP